MAHGHETLAEITGTAGRRTSADAHGVRNECTPTFYECLQEAFVADLNAFTEAVRNDTPLPLSLRDASQATRISLAIQQSPKTPRCVDV